MFQRLIRPTAHAAVRPAVVASVCCRPAISARVRQFSISRARQSPAPVPLRDPKTPAMTVKTGPSIAQVPGLYDYSLAISLRHTPAEAGLWEEIKRHPHGRYASTPDSTQFIGWLAATLRAKRCIEVGVFAGSTTLSLALNVPDASSGGRVVALDVSDEYTAIGAKYWKEAGVASRIDLRIGPAVDELKRMLKAVQSGAEPAYDLAFIDADKSNYDNYYELCLSLVRPGGVVLIDNVYWHGRPLDPNEKSAATDAITALNKKIKADKRVAITTLPLADGVTICRKL